MKGCFGRMEKRFVVCLVFLFVSALVFTAGCGTAGPAVPFDMPVITAPSFPDRVFDIRDYGAVGDGKTMNTRAIASAIGACFEAGGGKVLVPAGSWLTGPIVLKSNINLHIAKGAEVLFSTDFADYLPAVFVRWEGTECYNYSPLIYAKDCTNIAITGAGTVNGQGKAWWHWKKLQQGGANRLYDFGKKNVPVEKRMFGTEEDAWRPSFIQPVNCRNVFIEGITIKDGPMWTVHPVYCENLIVRNLKVITVGPNNDGVNPDSCKNVLIENCYFDTGDDCITIKSGRDADAWRVGKPCENILIRNCRTKRGHGGIVIGSEMSGGVRNLFAYDCHFDDTDRGIRLKSMRGRGGIVENIWIQDITMGKIRDEAILINMFYAASTVEADVKKAPVFRNIHIKNVTCDEAKQAIKIVGLEEQPTENVTLENITISAIKGFSCTDAKGVRLTGVNITPKTSPVMLLTNSQDVVIEKSKCPPNIDTFLKIQGGRAKNIRLRDNNLSNAKTDVVTAENVPADAVIH